MSAAATADRIVAGALVPADMVVQKGNADLRAKLASREVPVIVADNVAEYIRTQHERGRTYEIGGWPCLAPPWNWAFIEYPSHSGRQRRGAYMLSFDLAKATPDERAELTGMIGAAIEDARRQSPGEVVRWALIMAVFVDDGHHVQGPQGCVIWVLDEHGKELGNRWFLRPEAKWSPASEVDAMWLHAALLPALQTIAFMHCKNVVVDSGRRTDKLARAYRKRHRQEPLRWQTVRLELPRLDRGSEQATRPGSAPSLHIVVGHFAHYGDCCPSQHEPKGKLFGRLEGVYWMPQHIRGDPTREVRSDRVVTVDEVSA